MRYMATRTAKKQYIILLYGFNSTGALTGYFLIMTGRYFLVMTGHYWLAVQGLYSLCLT